MLTLDETIAAIKALDTEAEVIAIACKRIIKPEDKGTCSHLDAEGQLLLDLMARLQEHGDTAECLHVLGTLLGTFVSMIATPGKEIKLLDVTLKLVVDQFNEYTQFMVLNQLKTDPDKAIDRITTMLKDLHTK